MARLRIIVSSLHSSLVRTLPMATALRAAGHDIVIFGAEDVTEIIAQNRFAHRVIPTPWINPFTSPLPRPPVAERLSLKARRRQHSETIARYNVDMLADMLRAETPDLVIVNAELHAHIIVARGLGVKVALVASIYITAPALSAPPLHHAQVPGRGLGGTRYGIGAAWAVYRLRKRLVFARNAFRDWGADQPTALAQLARENGVDLRRIRRVNGWQMPWVYRLPTLLMLSYALDLPKKHWPNFRFVGGQTDTGTAPKNPLAGEYADFIAPKTSDTEKRILITFGPFLRPRTGVVRALLNAAAPLPDWRVLFVVQEKFRDALTAVPQNLQLAHWVPVRALMGHADVVGNHADNASILEAIDAGVPMLAYPINSDQFGAAARVAFHNIGVIGHPTDDANTVARHIEDLCADPSIKATLKEMKPACRHEIDSGAALQAVEDLLANRWGTV